MEILEASRGLGINPGFDFFLQSPEKQGLKVA